MGLRSLLRVVVVALAVSANTVEASEGTCRLNRAFVFVKPNAANAPKAIDLVRTHLTSVGIDIVEEGTLTAETIDEKQLIDTHYGAIASKAVLLKPQALIVPDEAKQKFAAAFGEDFAAAVAAGRVLNAQDACAALGMTEAELGEAWCGLKMGETLVKFGGGFYCGRVQDVWAINGFYMAMRALYVEEGASIVWMCVEWPENKLSWKDFRLKVVGATDPTQADPSSIRRQLLDAWQALGLPGAPSTKENGLHASASPLEALAERLNWLERAPADDPFGAELLDAGCAAADLSRWGGDPAAVGAGEGRGLFDYLENRDATDCLEQLLAQRE